MMSWYQSTDYYDQYKMAKIQEYMKFITRYGGNLFKSADDGQLVITKVVTKMVAPDTTAQIFWLKNRKPDDYRDKREVEHSGGMAVNNPFSELTKEQLLKIAGLDDE